MNTNNRFPDDESLPDRGVDGLLDEMARSAPGDDVPFLGELEQRLDSADKADAESRQEKRDRWSIFAKVAALVVISGIATFVILDRAYLSQRSAVTFLSDTDHAPTKSGKDSRGGEMSGQKVEQAGAEAEFGGKRQLGSLWDAPVSGFSMPADAAGEAVASMESDSVLFAAAATAESRDASQRGAELLSYDDGLDKTKAFAETLHSSLSTAEISGRLNLDESAVPGARGIMAEDGTIRWYFPSKKGSSKKASEVADSLHASHESQVDDTFDLKPTQGSWASTQAPRGAFGAYRGKRGSSTRSRVRYPVLVDNTFQSPRKEPLSTFSIDVDTASYSNVRRMIQSGESVPPDAVRIEELINYFDYSYMDPGQELPFSVNLEAAACPWKPEHRLVRVGLKGQEIEAEKRQAMNLVFLVDVSGSMNQERKLPLVQRSLHLLIDELREDDMITIVTYAGHEGVALAPTRGSNKAVMHSAVGRLRSSGGTNGEAGIKLAYKLASENFSDGGVNRILLATDGDFNIGVSSTEALRDLVKREAKRGVFLSVLGFGSDNLNDAMLETVTNDGNGTCHYIDSVSEGRKVLVEDLTSTMITIAKDVKIQVEFNPATVGAYRLIGYANRKLPPEAFNDDRVDAGDIGAGHTVTAFYEIIPPGLEGKAVDNLKYQVPVPAPSDPASSEVKVTGSNELLTVKLRHKAPRSSESQLIEVAFTDNAQAFNAASADFRFAASVAAFGLQLRQSPFRGNLTRNQVKAIAENASGGDSGRREFVELVSNAIVAADAAPVSDGNEAAVDGNQ